MISIRELSLQSDIGIKEFIDFVKEHPDAVDYLNFSSLKDLVDYIEDAKYSEWDELRSELEVYKKEKGLDEMHSMADDSHNEFHQVRADAIEEESKDNPCWRGYHPDPNTKTKMKGGKRVPNCVPINESDATEAFCEACLAEYLLEYADKIEEAEYRGRKVSLGKPFLTPGGPKKRSVYVKNQKGNVVKVNFGDPNMKIKKNIPARRKSFRARHHCDNPGPRWKANYWSCKAW